MTDSNEMSTAKRNWAETAAEYRRQVSLIISAVCIFILLVSDPSWPHNSTIEVMLETSGFLLIGMAVLGRLWSTLYICGYKEDRVVTDGPYSLVRNPLYVFSFLGALGIGLSTKNLLLLSIIAIAFIIYYPLVVRYEETQLLKKFGPVYLAYTKRVPRFFPRNLRLVEPEVYPAKPRKFRKSVMDAMWFFWFFWIIQLVEKMHQTGWLPIWFRIP